MFVWFAGLLASSHHAHLEGPATDHVDTGFLGFYSFFKKILRWFQVATACFSCSPPDIKLIKITALL
jgi:hypothetical protein